MEDKIVGFESHEFEYLNEDPDIFDTFDKSESKTLINEKFL